MSNFSVDCEMDGNAAGIHSMASFGAVVVRPGLKDTFYSGILKPISETWIESNLKACNITREEMLAGRDPFDAMHEFRDWIEAMNKKGRPIFWSDNPSGDFAFINYYFHKFVGSNPFGWSARRIGDNFCGFYKDSRYSWKKHRITEHTHHPVDDAKGNAEAMIYLQSQGYKIDLS